MLIISKYPKVSWQEEDSPLRHELYPAVLDGQEIFILRHLGPMGIADERISPTRGQVLLEEHRRRLKDVVEKRVHNASKIYKDHR